MKLEDIIIRDPYVLLENEMYYLYGSDKNLWGKADGFYCYKSKDFKEFSGPYCIFQRTDDFWADRNFWAPEVHKYKEKFYLFASLKAEDACRGTQIFVCDTPDGNFIPVSKEPVTPRDWECLDGTFYRSDEGRNYIVFCHEWEQTQDGTICVMELDDELKEAIGEPQELFRASDAKWNTEISVKRNLFQTAYVTDGPFLHRMKDNRLLMLWSGFHNGKYAMGQCISNEGIMGPFVQQDTALIEADGGHGMVYKDKHGKLRLVYHTPNKSPLERCISVEITETENGFEIKDDVTIK